MSLLQVSQWPHVYLKVTYKKKSYPNWLRLCVSLNIFENIGIKIKIENESFQSGTFPVGRDPGQCCSQMRGAGADGA